MRTYKKVILSVAFSLIMAAPMGFVMPSAAQSNNLALPDAVRVSGAGGTRLILLGTAGGPIIRKFRSQPSNLLVVNGVPYVIDAGAGTVRQLTYAGYRPVDVRAIFVTHHHLDHNADVGSLISFNWVESRKRPLPVIGPHGTGTLVDGALTYFSISERTYGTESGGRDAAKSFVEPKDIESGGLVYRDENVEVLAAENSHYATFDAGQDKSFSYRFNTKERSVVFTGDTGPSAAVEKLAKGADILVTEVIDAEATIVAASIDTGRKPDFNSPLAKHMRVEHMAPEEIGKLATKAGVKMVVLTHLAPGLDNETDVSGYSAGVKKYFKGSVIVGRDLMEF